MVACAGIPRDALKLSPTSLADRQQQTRLFNTSNELELLIAGAGVLQDMGYVIEESEKALGLITASKRVDATDTSQLVGAIIISVLTGNTASVDKEQKIRVSFVTLPSAKDKNAHLARVTFQRIIWNTNKQVTRVETLKTPELYQGFFEKLSKAVFLEANKI